jgi:hypothetical protein
MGILYPPILGAHHPREDSYVLAFYWSTVESIPMFRSFESAQVYCTLHTLLRFTVLLALQQQNGR